MPSDTALIEFATSEKAEEILKKTWVYAGKNLTVREKRSWSKPKNTIKGNSTVESITDNRKLLFSKENAVKDDENISEDLVETAVKKETSRSRHEFLQEVIKVETVMKNAGESNEEIITEEAVGKKEDYSPYTVCEEGNEKAITILKEKDAVSREELKCVFQRFGAVKHVDYKKKEDSGYIHFEKPEAAIRAHTAAELLEELWW